jgi:ABC-type transport system involved in multi-copper enzyme maturation permease subunit
MQYCTSPQSGYPTEDEVLLSTANTYSPVSLPDALLGTAFLLIVMGMLIGGSSIGAEWSAGTVTTLLVWEPRRMRALIVRMLAVVLTVVVMTVFLLVLLSLGLYAAAWLRGSTGGTGGPWLHHVLATIGRISLIAALISTIGLAVATVGRGTAAALGVLIGYLALFESLLRGLRPSSAPWLLASSAVTYLSGHRAEVFLRDGTVLFVSVRHSLIVTCAYSLVLFLIALVVFRRRDVS